MSRPMSEKKRERILRKRVARFLNKTPIKDPETGTLSYPSPTTEEIAKATC